MTLWKFKAFVEKETVKKAGKDEETKPGLTGSSRRKLG